jgi:hypothetical protein
MIYLTYEQYKEIGGICDETAFKRNIDRVCGIIDNATHNRIECMAEVPQKAKALCRDLVEYLANNITNNTIISSKSQSAGGVSESESYVIHSDEEKTREIENMIKDYLLYEFDDNGTSLLYRGCLR